MDWAIGGWWGSWDWATVYCCDRCPSTTALFPLGDGEGWLFWVPQWPLHCRAGKALEGHNGSFFRGAAAAGACIGFVQPAYLHQASLVTDTMAPCLQMATGQSVGMATIYPIELSRWAHSTAKDISWTGRVKQLSNTILSVVMSQEQRSAIERWLLTPFCDSKEKHRNEMGTKIQSHLTLLCFYSYVFCFQALTLLPPLFCFFFCGGKFNVWEVKCQFLFVPYVLLRTSVLTASPVLMHISLQFSCLSGANEALCHICANLTLPLFPVWRGKVVMWRLNVSEW